MLSLFDSEEAECQSQAPGSAKYFNWSAICEEVNDETISTILEDTNVTVDADHELTQYILAHAKILFALAEKTDALDLVPMLAKLKLTDDHLPIVWDKTQHRAKSLSGASKDDNALEWFKLKYDPNNARAARWHKSWIERFCSFQWEFLAPVFTDSEIVYPLHDSCPLPFTYYDMEPSSGANSLLYKGEIHASHWKAIRRESGITTANNFNVPVAIKTITKQHEAVDKWVQVEVAALELVRSLHHSHLINFLTSYRQAGNHYLIFDWANGKNLSDFWETHSTKPYDLPGQVAQLSHRESIIWAIQQMTGLAAGLHKLHSEDEHGVHCRHGDLKPANILRSTTDDDSRLKSHGHLLITDMGVAKVNDKATHVGRSSGNVKATIRYQSPEFLFRLSPDAPTSRAYDIWSMGCTLLEFIIWLLYGPTQLRAFNNSFPNTTFFSGNLEEGIKLNGAVKHWVDYMQQHPLSKDATPCISEALKDILDFIKERVLIRDVRPELEEPTIPVDERFPNEAQVPEIVVDAPQLEEAPAPNDWQDKQANFLELGESNITVDEPFPIETQVPEPVVDAPIIENAPVPNNWQDKRADSLELLKLLEKVHDREDLSYFLAEQPNGEGPLLLPPPPRKPTMAPPVEGYPIVPAAELLQLPLGNIQETTSMLSWPQLQPQFAELLHGEAHPHQPYVTEYLRESWDAIPDSELALELFPEIDSAHVVPANTIPINPSSTHNKNLCRQCSDESSGVFSLRFVCEESVEGLEKRQAECGVCWMLLQHAMKTCTPPQSKVKFLRSGSYLMQSALEKGIPDKPIFSIIVGPGITAAPKDLQRSFPRLPQAVTEAGREATNVTPKPRPSFTITGEEAKFVIMKKWIADCDKKHIAKNKDQPNCNPERSGMQLPTRLIYVGSVGKATKIHLDCSDTRDPGLKYIALSHRWGYPRDDDEWTDSDGKAKNFCTTNDNLVEFMDPEWGIDFAAMPKTFRDAIEVTRGLGLEYLWIDSLCIIQNQPDNADFNAESRRMRDVYNGAYCTIASTGADGTTDGFLNKKEDRACVRIETTRKVLDGRTPDSIDDKRCTVYVCDAIDDFKRDVDGSDMATRGWIFQERALSRRTLHFAKNQVYWECGAGVCCETLTRLFNRRATFMSDPDFPSQAGKYLKGMKIKFYESLYQHYSSLNFSVMANRAVAMDGLESKIFATFLTKGAYGIMDGEFLHRTFLWKRQEPLPEGAMHQIPFRKNDPTPPSWSWMAVSGKITYLPVDFDTVDWDTDHVLSPFRNTVDMLPVVADSQLMPIKAVARDINWKTVSSKAETLFLDRKPVPKDIPGLKCVVMGTKKEQPHAGGGRLDDSTFRLPVLLVAPKDLPAGYSGTPLYERVGVGKLEEHQMEAEPLEKQWVHIS